MEYWFESERNASELCIKRIPFDASKEWLWSDDGNLIHRTGRFFSITGIKYYSVQDERFVSQPIVDQPEIGLLAFLVSKDSAGWWILLHLKVEPGNINEVQLSPTVQATKSNYEAAHGGARTPYLELVQSPRQVLCNQLQSEQNSRFLKKRNRNCVVLTDKTIKEQHTRYKWVPIHQALPLLKQNHTVNTDARSVLTCWLFTDASVLRECLPPAEVGFSSLLIDSMTARNAVHRLQHLEGWLEDLNRQWPGQTEIISLRNLDAPWICTNSGISSSEDPSLTVYQISISCKTREVSHWDQPIFGSQVTSEQILILGRFDGVLHLLLQARLEAGNRYGFELTTTVQSNTTSAAPCEKKYLELAKKSGKLLLRFDNSEEGGRFDRYISQYQIILLDEATREQEGTFHRWVSLSQVSDFLRREKFITNELRSAMSALLTIRDVS